MIQTNTAYMSDPARAERTIRRFINLPLREMRQVQTQSYVDYIADKLVPIEGLTPEILWDMPYIQIACLIAQVGGSPQYDGYSYDSWALQMVYYQYLAAILRGASSSSLTIQLFMALPLKAFYACLESLCADGSMTAEFESIRADCSYRDGYAIEDFLAEKTKRLQKAWQPVVPLDAYERHIKTALQDIGKLLVGSFSTAFGRDYIMTGKE